MMKRVHLFISGRVQGVGFRYNTRKKARNLGVSGWVKNLDDGRVEVVAEGDENKLESLIDFCHKGPLMAKVNNVEVSEEEPTGEFDDFNVEY